MTASLDGKDYLIIDYLISTSINMYKEIARGNCSLKSVNGNGYKSNCVEYLWYYHVSVMSSLENHAHCCRRQPFNQLVREVVSEAREQVKQNSVF